MRIAIRKAGIGVVALVVVAAIAYYFYHARYGRFFQETNDATIQADQVAISSKLSGYVRTVPVTDNQDVAQGAMLVEIDPVDYRTKLTAADASITAAIAAQNASEASRSESMAAVAAARAGLLAAQADLDFAQREIARYMPLVKKGHERAATLSQLNASQDRAIAEMAAQKAALVQAERRVESIAAQTSQLGAEVDEARVQREAASTDLSFTRLIAPVSGKVANRSVRVGQFVQPGTRLMTIVPKQDIYVIANFKETQVGLIRPGQPAKIRADALSGVEFRGTVTSITPGTGANFSLIPPQNATGNFTKIVQRVPVRIRIDAGPAARRVLVPGLSLVVEVDTRASRDEMQAIRDEQDRRAP